MTCEIDQWLIDRHFFAFVFPLATLAATLSVPVCRLLLRLLHAVAVYSGPLAMVTAATSPPELTAAIVLLRADYFHGAAYGICIFAVDGGTDHRWFSFFNFSN